MKPDTIQYPTYTYPEIFSGYFFHDTTNNVRSCPEHALVFVISGELTVHCECGTTTVEKGEYIFLRKDTNTILERKSSGNEPFRSVFMGLNYSFLKKLRPVIDKKKISTDGGDFSGNIIKLPQKPYLESLYISLLPYLQWDTTPMKQVLEIKLVEAVYGLILTDERFYSCLFRFNESDIEEYEVEYTQQMDSSYIMMRTNDRVTDVYLDVAYKKDETQEVLDFCAKHNITADIELINMQDVNT